MKIGFIARGLTKGGVTRYVENILKIFNEDSAINNNLILFTDRKDFIGLYKNIQVFYIKKSNKIFWDYVKIIPYLLKVKLDVVFYSKNIIPFTHIFFRFKKINIIHDLAHFKKDLTAYRFLDTIYMKIFMRLSCLLADKVVAVSQATKKDIENIISIRSEKISVIYEGVSDFFRPQRDPAVIQKIFSKYNIKTPFIFYCGSLSPRKNVLRALLAFTEIKEQIPHNIYLAGGESWRDKEVREYIKNNLADRVFMIGNIMDEELICLYSVAALYLYPSLYEGFGLPILEAQACGCPVLTSNVTSCPEIAGQGAVKIYPYSVKEIKEGMLKILTDEILQADLIKEGFLNVARFSWQNTVSKILKICNE